MVLASLIALALTQQKPVLHLMVKDTLVGSGKAAKPGDVVDMEYTGKLADGTQFDSSVGRAPLQFVLGLGEVIKGWDEGVAGMREGGTRNLIIPPELAYGEHGMPPVIPGNATLNFVIKLVKIEPPVQKTVAVKGAGPEAKLHDTVYGIVKVSVQGGKTFLDSHDNQSDPVVPLQIGRQGMPLWMLTGLLGIQAGETRKVVVPPSLAFGDKGLPPADRGGVKAGSIVPPNSTLVFDVKCTKIEPWIPSGR